MELSTRQSAMMDFITEFIGRHGYSPSLRQIGLATDTSSTSVVAYNLRILERKDLIERERGMARTITLVPEMPGGIGRRVKRLLQFD